MKLAKPSNLSNAFSASNTSAYNSNAANAVYDPAHPHADSLAPIACGAESVPKKNFLLPLVAAFTNAAWCVFRFRIGKQ